MALIPRERIPELTDLIRKNLDQMDPVIDLDYVIKEIGGACVEWSSSEFAEHGFDDNISGLAIPKTSHTGLCPADAKFLVVVKSEDKEERKRFTKAHELGHVIIHMGYLIQEDWDKTNQDIFDDRAFMARYGASTIEYEANEFAAALLMPEGVFRREIVNQTNDDGLCDLHAVARIFHVSYESALNRGKFLKIFSWR